MNWILSVFLSKLKDLGGKKVCHATTLVNLQETNCFMSETVSVCSVGLCFSSKRLGCYSQTRTELISKERLIKALEVWANRGPLLIMMLNPPASKALYTISNRYLYRVNSTVYIISLFVTVWILVSISFGRKITYLFSRTNKGGFVGRLEFFILPSTTDEPELNGGSKVALKFIKALS